MRVVFVVGPIVALGFYLGMGGMRPSTGRSGPLPEHVVEAPDVQVRLREGGVRVRSEQTGETLRETDRLHLSGVDRDGRTRTEARMEVTDLPRAEAEAFYDDEARRGGWVFSEELTATMVVPDEGTLVRAYRKPDMLRVVMIGPPVQEGSAQRPVTIFESALDGPPEATED